MARPFATLDCETDPFSHGDKIEPFIWGLYHDDGYEEFEEIEDLIDFISDKEWVIYAHNGGRFDYVFLIEYLNEMEKIMLINGRIAKAKIGKCEIRDSYCILPVPLAAINKDEFEYWKMAKEHRHKHMREIKRYLHNDCMYLYDAINDFRENYGDNVTIASSAMKQWNKMSGLKPEKTDRAYFNDYKQYYHGGRVQCFESGIIHDDIELFDITSAYPYAMVHNHPIGKETGFSRKIPTTDKQIQKSMISIECESHGQFPIREKFATNFPSDGEVRTFHITGWEFIAARDLGVLDNGYNVLACHTFAKTINFKQYIDEFFAKKAQAEIDGKVNERIFAKLFLNALYGKFGANPENYQEYKIAPHCYHEAMLDDGWQVSGAPLDGKNVYRKDLEEYQMRYYNVATAASVTGFVRAYLFKSIMSCDRPLYCDTDSIMMIGKHDLWLDDEQLGAWKLEAKGERLGIGGKKLYCLEKKKGTYKGGDKNRFKTATKGARLEPLDIFKICEGEEIMYKNEAPSMSLTSPQKYVARTIRKTA